jgi:Carboxypeptidase regulatory-like domain
LSVKMIGTVQTETGNVLEPAVRVSRVSQSNSILHKNACKALFGIAFGCVLTALSPIPAQSWQASTAVHQSAVSGEADLLVLSVSPELPQKAQAQLAVGPQAAGQVRGTVVDRSGVPIAGVTVTLTRDEPEPKQETITGEDGKFVFARVEPGSFHLTVTAPNFAKQSFDGSLSAGQNDVVPQIVLAIATAFTEVRVTPPTEEMAQEQLKEQEKQRALGFLPNFYVTYVPDAAPLSPKQKFQLAFRSLIDPVNFGLTAAVAAIEQDRDDFHGYGQGPDGYGRRYGAAYGDGVIGTMIGSAILPSLLKQDPRYFYKGTGTKRSRVFYALKSSVMCKGDNGRWQANYSSILGSMAAAGLSNLYYPPEDRNGLGLTVSNTLINIGATAAANILQEFVIKKITPNLPNHDPNKSPNALNKLLGSFVQQGD